MASNIRASSKRTSATARASLFGAMVVNMKVAGTKESRVVSVSTSTTINRGAKATGLMDVESVGLMKILMHLLSDLNQHFLRSNMEHTIVE